MELKLNVSKVLILDMPLNSNMLNDNQAVIGEIEGESVLITKVNVDEITEQARKQTVDLKEEIGVSKSELFTSWEKELGWYKAVLLSCNYDVKKVVEMSEEDAESEVQAIGD
jgi:hypothetical protein